MSAALELRVAQAVMAARQLERALHDPGPWTINGLPAERHINEDSVRFVVIAHVATQLPTIILRSASEVVLIEWCPVSISAEGRFTLKLGLAAVVNQ